MELLIIIIILALVFDYINGFHDAANSIATVVSTKVLSPFQAVMWAAFFNAIVLFLCQHKLFGFEFKVADAVAKIVKTESIDLYVIMAGIIAAIVWNLLTWWLGIPSSSSHTLMGGFAGAAIAKAGFGVLADIGKIYQTLAFIFIAPLAGMLLAYIITIVILHLCKRSNPSKADGWFRKLQLASSAAFSLGHGSNDAQKVMGIIAAAILVFNAQQKKAGHEHISQWNDVQKIYKIDTAYFALNENKLIADTIDGKAYWIADADLFESKGKAKSKHDLAIKNMDLIKDINHNGKLCFGAPQESYVKVETFKPKSEISKIPGWIQYACFLAIALGTLSGGWKIIKTMGTKITKVTPLEGVAAETAGAITLYATQALGIPVSTTHTITGSIIGVGLSKRLSAVRWGVTINLLWAWLLTIPVSGLMGALIYYFTTFFSK
jgi:inorganic phosphate transporter, PiT family